ncbi:hypothetical protein ACFSYH_12615 [Populibacterium corticicola]|uniref:Uncharacterized protein n=1 Tax=Populibacterium corticicola TaxID=1812826 RepID=A0ABW5XG21_9MICO
MITEEALRGFEEFRAQVLGSLPPSVHGRDYAVFDTGVEWVLYGERTSLTLYFAWINDFWSLGIVPEIFHREYEDGRPLQDIPEVVSLLERFDLVPLVVREEKIAGLLALRLVEVGDLRFEETKQHRLLT